MRKFRKLIGIIISQSDSPNQAKFLEGVFKQAFKLNYDVAVFSTFSTHKLSDEWHDGELNIFSLINYSALDGLIFLPDTLTTDNFHKVIEADIKKKFRKPVVSVDLETEGFDNIHTDDIQSIKTIISHLIEKHKMTDIAFMTGTKGHPHATNRLTGYYEALIEHNLPIDQSRVFYGDFWYNEGENVVKRLMESGRPLPQAIACASDTMAISICEALKARDIKIPEDIVVTGYDSIDAGVNYVPSITSANLPLDNTGTRAVNKLHSLITGTEFKDIRSNAEILIAKSCGCSVNIAEKIRNERESWRDNGDMFNTFDSTYNFMLEALISKKDYVEYMNTLCWYGYLLGEYEKFYLCMCDNWDNLGETESNSNYLKKGYTKKMNLLVQKSPDTAYVEPGRFFDVKEMLPAIYERRPKPTAFFFSPIHFNDRCFGYSVITYGERITSYSPIYRKWIRYVCASLESFRRQRNLQYMYTKMEENAVTDLLTGIYNRNGFNIYADRIFHDAKMDKQKFTLILGDMNNLKYINDTFGHIEGDFALKTVADAFTKACSPDMMCFRMGGDEYVIASRTVLSEKEIAEIEDSIKQYLKNINDTADKPYSISVSLGWYFDEASNLDSIEHAVSIADEKMFMAKEKYKREEGFNYKRNRSSH
ncbi:MAG: GGDEF domain-containing protein [Oscillospiraceae bacterium]|nr:GGDEF domain-containing protein [Oscillospiraceae bacterium]